MSEAKVIKQTKTGPVTVDSLIRDFRTLGLQSGQVLLVHSSLSSLGWVNGGPVAVIQALEEVLGPEGTLVMPAHSSSLSDPRDWQNPPVPEGWKETIRQTMPAFDPDLTPCRSMGVIAETFRKQSGVRRSDHPQSSFSAWGRYAEQITKGHQLEYSLGEGSPLARIYDLAGSILLLGVTHENNTSLHLAETRANFRGKREIDQGAPILRDGQRVWVEFKEVEDHTEDFQKIGKAYQKAGGNQQVGKVGGAVSLLVPQRDLVDFAVAWMEKHRDLRIKGT